MNEWAGGEMKKRKLDNEVITFLWVIGFVLLDFIVGLIASILGIHWLLTLTVIVGSTVMTIIVGLGVWAFIVL